ncbi:MAG: hypothetical protein FJ303_01965 [Planctomycetes bacterium]|nr:hypothetical protein [Planctomycetota bacterium]
MKYYRWIGLVLALGVVCPNALAQLASTTPIFPAPSPLSPEGTQIRPTEPMKVEPGSLSPWIVYRRECCEGGTGFVAPIYTEIYVSSGPTFPVGGMTLSRELQTGWSFMVGARALFFNEPHDRAWLVDLHFMRTHESGGKQDTQFPVVFFQNGRRSDQPDLQGNPGRTTFSIQDSGRSMVGLGLGRVWYPWRPANDEDGCRWRIGVDAGGRYGAHRINFNEFGHVTDAIGSVYAGVQTMVEIPWRTCLFQTGVRFEWAYTWSDILQRTSDVQDLSVMLTIGLRY